MSRVIGNHKPYVSVDVPGALAPTHKPALVLSQWIIDQFKRSAWVSSLPALIYIKKR
ncbi:MAG: hypothetical protein ABI417_08725 [Coleofasciculaceae cyanobacterium]